MRDHYQIEANISFTFNQSQYLPMRISLPLSETDQIFKQFYVAKVFIALFYILLISNGITPIIYRLDDFFPFFYRFCISP